jgi:tripartite-type tricarboxylate transporter receptor subunit TctC
MVAAGHTITPSVIRKLPYDPVKDFSVIGFIGSGAFVLVVGPQSPAKSVQDFIALARARPGHINYAHTGYGNVAHLSAELFKVMTGIDMQGIHYKGGGPALTDLIGGQINAFFAGLASSSALIRAGKVRALGVTNARRSASLPEVPAIAEAGLAGYDVDGWYGLLAPAATPHAAIQRYNRELNVLLNMPEVKERLLTAGIEASPSTPAEFQARITRDLTRWAEVVKKARISVE